MTFLWHDWAGYIGVVLVLLAFLLLQAHKLHGNGLVYQLMNVLGALGVILSLIFGVAMNWPAFLMQVAWIVIGVYGIVHSARARREARELGSKITS
ncbi:membrane protein [Dyella jiangningensis]|jgi:paired small multidrug resistance pump|nr:membrane protein [Dyella jiangningensis]